MSLQVSPKTPRLHLHWRSKADFPVAPIHWMRWCSSLSWIFQIPPKCPERGREGLDTPWPFWALHVRARHRGALALHLHSPGSHRGAAQPLSGSWWPCDREVASTLSLEDLHVVFSYHRGNRFSLSLKQNEYWTLHLSLRDFNALKLKIVNVLNNNYII